MVVATEELKEPILVDILELNVEYPVVPVISICDEPETNVGTFVKLLKLIEPVKELALTFPSTNIDPVNKWLSSDVSPNLVLPLW